MLAPLTGRLLSLQDVPDPVFAEEQVGPGVALDPGVPTKPVTVRAPVAGRLVKVLPHAFVVLGDDGVGILVHLGMDTVRLGGQGSVVLLEEGTRVEVGDAVVLWDTALARAEGLSLLVPVVAMDRPKGSVQAPSGVPVAVGDLLYEVAT